jgi:hypothetical protein
MMWGKVLGGICLWGLSATGLGFGQAGGVISGIVTDERGAAIMGAVVEVRNVDTRMSRRVETDERGWFRVGSLVPGRYEIDVQREGFQRVIRRVEVGVAQEVRIDVQLPVGAITESILVTGEEEKVLEVSRTELSQGILPVQIRQLPVRGRNFVDLTLLTPRVIQSDRSSQGSAQQTFGTQHLQLSFSGLRNQYNLMLMDGADATWHIAQLVILLRPSMGG